MALIDYLKKGELPVPQAITAPPPKDAGPRGLVTPTFDEGSLLVKNHHDKYFRLVWPKESDPKSADRRRALEPGSYKLTGYHFARRDKEGKEWFLWVNLHKGRALDVKADEPLPVKTDDSVIINCKAKLAPGDVTILANIMGEHHAGVTIYKEGKRIPIVYKITKDNKTLASGTLQYG